MVARLIRASPPSSVHAALLSCLVFLVIFPPVPALAQRIKLDVGLDELEKTARADSNDATAHYNLALGYWSKARHDDAEAALRRSASLDARQAQTWLALSVLPFARRSALWNEVLEDEVPAEWIEDIEESDRHYRRAFLLDPMVQLRIIGAVVPGKSVLWQVDEGLARLYDDWLQGFDDFRDGDYAAAYFRLQRLIDLLEDYGWRRRTPAGLLWYRGLAAAHLERWDEAIADFEDLLEESLRAEKRDELVHVPLRTNEYRYVLAYLHQKAGMRDRAADLYREALLEDIGLYMAHVRLAEIHESRQQWASAIDERRRAIETSPDDPSLTLDLGVTLARAGRVEAAAEALREAGELAPRDPRPHYLLGLVETELGRTEEAKAAFRRFLDLAPGRFGSQAADARRRLEALP